MPIKMPQRVSRGNVLEASTASTRFERAKNVVEVRVSGSKHC